MHWLYKLTVVNGSWNIVKPQAYWEGLDGSNLGPKTPTKRPHPSAVLHGAGDAQSASAMEPHSPKAHVSQRVPHQQSHHCSSMNLSRDHIFWHNWRKSTDTVSSSILKGYTLWYTPCTPAKSVYFCVDNPWGGPDTMWGSMKYSRKSRSLWPSIRFQFFSSGKWWEKDQARGKKRSLDRAWLHSCIGMYRTVY